MAAAATPLSKSWAAPTPEESLYFSRLLGDFFSFIFDIPFKGIVHYL